MVDPDHREEGYVVPVRAHGDHEFGRYGRADGDEAPGTTHDFDGYVLVDLQRLHKACRAAGVELPPYRPA